MNVLIINGSPRGKRSNSYQLTKAFLEGMKENHELTVDEIDVCQLEIHHCLGCFSCWHKTPGKCCIKDDMIEVLQKRVNADTIIWSFPLYYFSLPGKLKTLIDRQLPMIKPNMVDRTDGVGNGSHPARYDLSHQRNVIISTCGFYTAKGNYDGVESLFNHMLGLNNYECIFCGQGELFHVDYFQDITDRYLQYVKQAGKEYMEGQITSATYNCLNELLLPKETFEQMVNLQWAKKE